MICASHSIAEWIMAVLAIVATVSAAVGAVVGFWLMVIRLGDRLKTVEREIEKLQETEDSWLKVFQRLKDDE